MRSSSVPAGVVIASLIAVLYVAIGLWAGVGQSWDSNFYLLFSQDLRLNGRIDFGQGLYAPLYPLLLASLTILGLNSELALCVVNAGSAGAIFLAAFVAPPTAYRFPTRLALGCLATVVAIGSPTFRYAWTEPLYAALLMWACVEALRAARSGRVSAALLVLLGLLPLTRFVGLFVSLAIIAYLVFDSKLGQGRTRATEQVSVAAGLVAVAASVGPIALLAASNLSSFGCAFGCHGASTTGPLQNVGLAFTTLRQEWIYWLFPLGLVCIAILASACFGWERHRRRTGPALPLLIVFVGVTVQITLSSFVLVDPIDSRFLSPYFPLITLAFASALPTTGWQPSALRVGVMSLLILAVVATSGLDVLRFMRAVNATSQSGSLADFGYKRTTAFGQFRDLANTLPAGSAMVAYFPTTEGYGNLAAYLFLNSAYWDGACRVVKLDPTAAHGGTVQLECPTRGLIGGTMAGSPEQVTSETMALVLDKVALRDDDRAKLEERVSKLGLNRIFEAQLSALYQREF